MKTYHPMRRPDQQGHIDGMCGLYSVLNATSFLFDLSAQADHQLFRELCLHTKGVFPEIVCDGVNLPGVESLLHTAKRWAARNRPGKTFEWTMPLPRSHIFETARAALDEMRALLHAARSAHERAIWIVGLGPPWGHFTTITGIDETRVLFRDSYGIEHRDIAQFTTDKAKGGHDKIMLDYHESILATVA
ncbi:MAG: hypothetical protein KGM42_11275 [Hyphomicrobiales bacterium]|nr:hypothetical protein [Hyphomicrobiales bacterium]